MDFDELLNEQLALLQAAPIERESIPDIALYMEQVTEFLNSRISGVYGADDKAFTKMMINNYTKARILDKPVNKKYDRSHITRLIEIFALKQQFNFTQIAALLNDCGGEQAQSAIYDAYAKLSAKLISDYADRVKHISGMIDQSLNESRAEADESERLLLLALLTALQSTLDRRLIAALIEKPEAK